jgi:protein-tyrosine-phosphatase
MKTDLVAALSALAHPQRLAVFRLLMRRYPDRVPAGEIGAAIGARPSTLSAYLADLSEAGLIDHERRGTSLLYRVRLDGLRGAMADLLDTVCRGRADPPVPARAGRVRHVLFLGTGNAARSLMAEALLREADGARSEVFSAGLQASGSPDPGAMAMLAELGHEAAPLWSKPADTYLAPDAPRMDVVITLCDRAANAGPPAWPGRPVQAHWGLPDPVAEGTAEAYARTYLTLRARLGRLAALPPGLDRAQLQRALDDLAAVGPEAG